MHRSIQGDLDAERNKQSNKMRASWKPTSLISRQNAPGNESRNDDQELVDHRNMLLMRCAAHGSLTMTGALPERGFSMHQG